MDDTGIVDVRVVTGIFALWLPSFPAFKPTHSLRTASPPVADYAFG
jgi:hypothetical protein